MSLYKVMLAIFAMMIIALNTVLCKFGLDEFPPLLFTFLRFAFALPFLFFIPKPNVPWKVLLLIGLSVGGFHVGLMHLGIYLGATPGLAVFMLQTGAFFAIAFAYLLMNAKPSRFDMIGIMAGFIGLYFLCASKTMSGGILVVLVLLGAAMMWGFGYVLVKKVAAPPLPTTVWMSLLVAPMLGVCSLYIDGFETIRSSLVESSRFAWFAAMFSSWASMLAAGGIIMYLMRTEHVSKVVPFNLLIPFFGCIFSWLLTKEALSLPILIGGAWILIGVATSQFGLPLYNYLFPARKAEKAAIVIKNHDENDPSL